MARISDPIETFAGFLAQAERSPLTVKNYRGDVMWPDDFVRYKDLAEEDRICVVKGFVERNREEPGLVLNRILTVEQAQQELAKCLWLLFRLGKQRPHDVDRVASILRRTPGTCPVQLTVVDPVGKKAIMRLGREFSVHAAEYAKEELEAILGEGTVKLT
jgi:DNA polymerase-3 subunit alpha